MHITLMPKNPLDPDFPDGVVRLAYPLDYLLEQIKDPLFMEIKQALRTLKRSSSAPRRRGNANGLKREYGKSARHSWNGGRRHSKRGRSLN